MARPGSCRPGTASTAPKHCCTLYRRAILIALSRRPLSHTLPHPRNSAVGANAAWLLSFSSPRPCSGTTLCSRAFVVRHHAPTAQTQSCCAKNTSAPAAQHQGRAEELTTSPVLSTPTRQPTASFFCLPASSGSAQSRIRSPSSKPLSLIAPAF